VGFYLGCTAVRDEDVATVRDAVVRYAGGHGLRSEVTAGAGRPAEVASVYPPRDGWTVVIWPNDFAGTWPVARSLSADLATAVSAVEVIAGSYWTHAAFDAGMEVDRFSVIPDNSVPFELEGNDEATVQVREALAGNASRLAAMFDRPAEVIQPYLGARPVLGPACRP
jgi:hypothetical protein